MKKAFYFSFLALAFTAWQGCDKVDFPIQPGASGPTGNPNVVIRKAMIEDYTGHTCGNCPPTSEAIDDLKDQYGSSLVQITVHAGFLAFPGSSPYQYNFLTSVATDYHNTLGVSSYPTGVINRRNWPAPIGMLLNSPSNFELLIDSIINDVPEIKMDLSGTTYNSSLRQLDVSVKSKFLTEITGFYKLVVLFIEDSIQKPQKDDAIPPSFVDLNYYHRHVLRAAINGGGTAWGDTLFSGTVNAGDSITQICNTFTIPLDYNNGSNWSVDDRRCYVVAYIYDAATASPTRYEVIQVEEKKVR